MTARSLGGGVSPEDFENFQVSSAEVRKGRRGRIKKIQYNFIKLNPQRFIDKPIIVGNQFINH